MGKFEQNQAIIRNIRRSTPYRAPPFEASTGKLNSDGTINPNPSDGLEEGFVWIRRKGERAETRAYAGKVRTDIADIPVLVAQDNITGELTVQDIRSSEAVSRFGGAWARSMYAQPIGEAFRVTIDGRNIKPGRIKVWIPGTLQVNAEEFWYNNTAQARVLWEPGDTNALDLSSNVPAASGGYNQQRWVVIALNPNATTPALVAFNGTAIKTGGKLLKASIKDIAVTAGYTRLAAVQLRTGDSDESDITDDEWEDLRPWVVDVNYSAITGAVITNSTIDSSVIGGTTPAAITGTTVTGTTITATVQVLVNTTTQAAAQIQRDNAVDYRAIAHSNTATVGPALDLRRGRDTIASPNAVQANDVLGRVNYRGWDGDSYDVGGFFRMRAAENWTTTAHGSFLEFSITALGDTNNTVAWTIHPDKQLELAGALSVAGLSTMAVNDTTTNAVTNVLTMSHNTTGTPATGLGVGTLFQAETSTTTNTNLASIQAAWATVTHASRKGRVTFNVYDTAAREAIVIEASGSAAMLGFLGAAAVARPTAYTQNYTTTSRTVNAYTTDSESVAYTGIDNAQAGTVYATLTDLNALRTAYENLRAMCDNLLQVNTQQIDDLQAYGLYA